MRTQPFTLVFQEGASADHRIRTLISTLQNLVYEYVCRSLFKTDRLMFALHMVHGMFPETFKENVGIPQYINLTIKQLCRDTML